MLHVYTGNGKGKTTAAIGMAIRAAGAHKQVFIGQFIKGKKYSELNALARHREIIVEQFGRGCFIRRAPSQRDIVAAMQGWLRVQEILSSCVYDLVILDELTLALHLKMLPHLDVLTALRKASRKSEIVVTGRAASAELMHLADLVSSIREVKHYYNKGIKARRGIEY